MAWVIINWEGRSPVQDYAPDCAAASGSCREDDVESPCLKFGGEPLVFDTEEAARRFRSLHCYSCTKACIMDHKEWAVMMVKREIKGESHG